MRVRLAPEDPLTDADFIQPARSCARRAFWVQAKEDDVTDITMHRGKFTIYTNAHTVGWNKIEVRAYGVEKREHVYDGQDDVLAVHYIAKGCRRTDVTYNHVVIVANGHGLPDAPGMWGASSKAGNITTRSSRYRSGDPRWLDDLKLVVDGLEVVFERITGAWSAAQSAA